MSFNELDLLGESENYVSGSESPVKYVGSAIDVGFGDFVLNGI